MRRAQRLLTAIPREGQVGIKTSDLITKTGIQRPAIYHALAILQRDGLIIKGQLGLWHKHRDSPHTITSSGEQASSLITLTLPGKVIADREFWRAIDRYI
jgi:hypothetical protein